MDRLIHTSLSAMRSALQRQSTIANNLSNASTVGFKAEMANANPVWLKGDGLNARVASAGKVVAADMEAAAVSDTGRSLDVALRGDALLAVQARSGEEAYTRRGDLQLSETGLLTTGGGVPVLGEGGPITLPPADKVTIDDTGAIWIVPMGADPAAPPQQVDRLKLVSPAGSNIAKGLDGLFRVQGGGALADDPDARVQSGALEGSNVNTATSLVQMIEASRAWETQIKLVTTAKELDQGTADLMRLD